MQGTSSPTPALGSTLASAVIFNDPRHALRARPARPKDQIKLRERQPALTPPALPPIDVDEFRRRWRERERAARLEELARRNAALF